jgi:hypothetical protein
MRSPPLVPAFDCETRIVFDHFGSLRVYRETHENEVDRETVIRNIINGHIRGPCAWLHSTPPRAGRATSPKILNAKF